MSDERKGRLSASSLQRVMECEAAGPLELRYRHTIREEARDEARDDGILIHEALMLWHRDGTTPVFEKSDHGDELKEKATSLVGSTEAFISATFATVDRKIIEERFESGSGLWSGRLDLAIVGEMYDGEKAIALIDYKTGFMEVPPAGTNAQVQGYLTLLAEHVGLKENVKWFWGAIFFPFKDASIARFSREEVLRFGSQIENAVEIADAAFLDLTPAEYFNYSPDVRPGGICQYCAAKLTGTCHRLNESLALIEAVDLEPLSEMTPSAVSDLLDRAAEAKAQIRCIEREGLARVKEDPGSLGQRWVYESSGSKREVTDLSALHGALTGESGVTTEDFLSKCKIGVGDATKLHKDATGYKGKAASSDFHRLTSSIIEKKEFTKTLRRGR